MQTSARVRIIACIVAAALAVVCLADSKNLSLVVRPAFFDLAVERGVFPLVIEIANKGEDAKGSVVVRSQSLKTAYPVDLPRGSKKRLIAYVDYSYYFDDATAALETDQGDVRLLLRFPDARAPESIGLIGGNVGDLTFLRSKAEFPLVSDSYGVPGSLPDRPSGYSAFAAIALGEGAERMTDDEVEALKTWAVGGGKLIFTGGATSAVLSDPRWKLLLPVERPSDVTVDSLIGLQNLGGSPPPPGRISLKVGKVVDGTDVLLYAHGHAVVVRRAFGVGQVIYMAFDPLQPPLKQWRGLQKLFTSGIGIDATKDVLREVIIYGPKPTSFEQSDSPFDASLPSTGMVFLILFAHLIIAVPVNLLFLRKMGKGEMAWLTTPIICIAFAAIFFALASDLYSKGAAVRTSGVLVASSLRDTGYFRGYTELFIPQSGTYDVGLDNVDSIGAEGIGYYPYGEGAQQMEVMDDGEIHMESLRVPNLAFRAFLLSQRVEMSGWIEGSIRRSRSNGEILCKITNGSPFPFENTHLHVGAKKFVLDKIGPGETVNRTLNKDWTPSEYGERQGATLVGNVVGLRVGPMMGEDSGSTIQLVYVWEDFE